MISLQSLWSETEPELKRQASPNEAGSSSKTSLVKRRTDGLFSLRQWNSRAAHRMAPLLSQNFEVWKRFLQVVLLQTDLSYRTESEVEGRFGIGHTGAALSRAKSGMPAKERWRDDTYCLSATTRIRTEI